LNLEALVKYPLYLAAFFACIQPAHPSEFKIGSVVTGNNLILCSSPDAAIDVALAHQKGSDATEALTKCYRTPDPYPDGILILGEVVWHGREETGQRRFLAIVPFLDRGTNEKAWGVLVSTEKITIR
jgi:hypothetical protein